MLWHGARSRWTKIILSEIVHVRHRRNSIGLEADNEHQPFENFHGCGEYASRAQRASRTTVGAQSLRNLSTNVFSVSVTRYHTIQTHQRYVLQEYWTNDVLFPRPLGASSLIMILKRKLRDEFWSSIWPTPLYQGGQDLRSEIRTTPTQVWRRPLADMLIQSNGTIGVLHLSMQRHMWRCFVQCRNKSNIREFDRVKVDISNRIIVEKVFQSQLAHSGISASAQCNNVSQWRVATETEFVEEKFGCTKVFNR